MSDSTLVSGSRESGADSSAESQIAWAAAAKTPEFRELTQQRKRFIVPATVFFLAWYFGFIVLAGYAPDFMGREFLTDGLTVGYALALSQFVMTWGLAWVYLRKSDRVFDPLAKRAAERAAQTTKAAPPSPEDGSEHRSEPAGRTGEVGRR